MSVSEKGNRGSKPVEVILGASDRSAIKPLSWIFLQIVAAVTVASLFAGLG